MARRVKKTDSREVDHWVSTDDGRHLPIDKDGNIIFGSSKKSTSKSKTISSKSSKKDTSKSDSSKKKAIDEDKIYEIADRYNSSEPVSGDWNTELDHEIATIQKEFGLSKSEAKDAMKKYLGFTDDDFADDEPAPSSKSKSSSSDKPKSAAPAKKSIQVTDKQKRAAQVYLKNVAWKSAVDGEQSAEISDRHWGWAGMSNEKMANVLNTVDPEHEYRIEHDTEEKRVMGVKTKFNHHYIVRDKITPEVTESKKRSSAPKPTRKSTSSKTNKMRQLMGNDKNMVEWKINRAFDKTSLKELALDAGVPSSKVRTMSTEELRAMLLAMWKGK